jgi:hypothetical protein
MAIGDDFSIATNGDIRYTGSGTNYTVLAFHQWIAGLLDDAQASGDDLADITTDTISDRSTDNIVTLNAPFNIDDTAARHLYDGSITQSGGDTQYSGVQVLGVVETGTEIMIVQDDKVLPAYWGTGINADAPNNVIMSLMIKSRDGGADIDGKRILTFGRELGDTFAEFPVTLGLGVSVSAISTLADLNNAKSRVTLEGYTTVGVTEGLRLLDIDNDTVNEEYYEEWDKGSQTLNDTYEVSKWWSARSLVALNGADTGTDYVVDDATIVGQAQSFTARGQNEILTEARFRIKIGAGAPTGPMTAELYASTAGIIPTGAALATSEEVLASLITSSYQEVIFRFNDNVTLTASTQYCIVIRHPGGAAGDYFHVEGAASGTVGGENAANENPASTWNAAAAADLHFTVKSCPTMHGRAGELHRGVTQQIVYDGESGGPFTEGATLFWGTRITYDGEAGTFERGRYVEFQPSGGGTIKNGGKILWDDTTGNVLYVALENIAPTVALADNDIITQIGGTAASADIATTIVDDDKDGGEGILLALDDDGTTGNLYVQLISGKAPVDDLRISEDTDTFCLVNTTVTGRTISQPFIGSTTGTNLIGAYGIGFETADVGASDKFFDLTNAQRVPPNNVTFTVTGLVSGEDRVLVGPRSGTSLDTAQFTTDTALTGGTETEISIATVAIPTDTPATGTGADPTRLRVQLDSGIYRQQAYTSYDATTPGNFAIASTDYSGANAAASGNEVFIAYIDVLADATSEAYTAVYDTDRDLLVRVRDGGATPIKTFEATAAQFLTNNQSVAAIRQSDA